MKKDYSNLVIKNKSGYDVQITNIKGYNSKGETLYGYICSKCGKESFGTLDKIKRNKGCKYCKNMRISNSELLSKNEVMLALYNNNSNVELIGEYRGKNYECAFKCNKHNIYFSKKPSSFLYYKTKVCPDCIAENKASANVKYSVNDIENILLSTGYLWLNKVDYKDASTILLIQCKKCGSISKSNISSILGGRKCRNCIGMNKKTTDDYKKEVYELVGNEYTVLGTYKDNKTHIKMKHNQCGNEWDISPTNFLYHNRRCPKCKESKGEKAIANYLINNHIKYYTEYSFDDCCYKRKLRFDFYLIDYDVCIEFQGKQHYVSVDYMGGQDDFNMRKIRDNIKLDYCKNHNIELIEIPYNQIQNIEQILNQRLLKITA